MQPETPKVDLVNKQQYELSPAAMHIIDNLHSAVVDALMELAKGGFAPAVAEAVGSLDNSANPMHDVAIHATESERQDNGRDHDVDATGPQACNCGDKGCPASYTG